MNDRSPRLPLNHKYLQERGVPKNKYLIPLMVTGGGFILGPGWRIFRPTVLEFDARRDEPETRASCPPPASR